MTSYSGSLFDSPAEPWSPRPSSLFVEVAFNRPVRAIYTYLVPDTLVNQVLAGKRVQAPFGKGNRPEVGFCVRVTDEPPTQTQIKAIEAVLDERPLLTPTMLRLTRWIADYYFAGWGQVLDAVIPRAVKDASGTRVTVLLAPVLDRALDPAILPPKQRQAWEVIATLANPTPLEEVTRLTRVSPAVLRGLVAKGWVKATKERRSKSTESSPVVSVKPMTLNPHQSAACRQIIDAIRAEAASTFLVHGVTGSGKTEVYLQSIAEVVQRGREAIVLVPEISLTPQTIERFRGRFERVAVLHSHLTDAQRHGQWRAIRDGQVQVVIGARSAIFAPCPNLGLIIIDEEHETTFKQETTPRYHAREVALERARLERVPVVLGSATPSLESWAAAKRGEYTLLSLPERVAHLTLPRVETIDLKQEYRRQRGLAAIGPSLHKAVVECLLRKGQVILLLNRRGFAPAILCPQCGHVEKCNHCDISLTFHKSKGQAVCHSCDTVLPAPRKCSSCGHADLRLTGFGTQRLEDEVRARFPAAKIERMDSDTMRSAGHYERVLGAFRAGEVDILLGTQMIAKGLDFPNVQLVGVISADIARNLPDFRASERLFQLIVQVSGRAGRGKDPGLVLVQSFNPDDPALVSAVRSDFETFVRRELSSRRDFHYPPFGKLTRIILRCPSESAVQKGADALADQLRQHQPAGNGIAILGPAPAPVTRVRDYYRYHLQLHTPDHESRLAWLESTFADFTIPSPVEHVVDIDPIDLL